MAVTAIAFTALVFVALLTSVSPVAHLLAQATNPGQGQAKGLPRALANRTANRNADRCNAQGNADVRACLVPASDVMHDPAKRVAPGSDCFWRKDGTKRFEDVAGNDANGNGVRLAFRFIVVNTCTMAVEVQLTLAPVAAGSTSTLEFDDCTGTVFSETLAGGETERIRTCMSRPYKAGTLTFTRTFSIDARSPGAGTFVPFDPEVVIEEGRAP